LSGEIIRPSGFLSSLAQTDYHIDILFNFIVADKNWGGIVYFGTACDRYGYRHFAGKHVSIVRLLILSGIFAILQKSQSYFGKISVRRLHREAASCFCMGLCFLSHARKQNMLI
jgi:hypothetical protein